MVNNCGNFMAKDKEIETEQDSGDITAGKLFEQFHIIYLSNSFYESQSFRTAKLKFLIEKALKQGIDINIQGLFKYTFLHKAIYHELYDVAEFLLEKGASTELQDLDGYTPLQLAAHEGYTEMVKLLIIYGANCQDKNLIELVPDDKPELKAFLSLTIACTDNNSAIITKDNDTTNSCTGSRISRIVEIAEEPEDFKYELRRKFTNKTEEIAEVTKISDTPILSDDLIEEMKELVLKLTGEINELSTE